ncbi:EcsC family protein [Pseudarthrobacter sp. J1738]|uniref:EcsC family protein n=1 Tax=Pseudarthrobacter sp. J1738 TaxID=3420446 RepID=UPI003D286FC1
MSADTNPAARSAQMSDYESQTWHTLNDHWRRRNNRHGLPNWASSSLQRSGEFAFDVADRVKDAVPEVVKEPMRRAGDTVSDMAMRPAISAVTGLLDLVNDWALELNDSTGVETLARKRGIQINNFKELQSQDLKVCDRLLSQNTLKWRTAGAIEGAGMGLLATVPVAGSFAAMTADILVIQVLSTAIATRIAYSYGFDAKDPSEQVFIQRLVRRSFVAQATKVKPLRDAARAAGAIKDRVRWSPKLRQDHRLLAALEKLMQQSGKAGAAVRVQDVAKAVPYVGVIIGAGANSIALGNVAADAQRYCQTRFLCDKYGIPLPEALVIDPEDESVMATVKPD